MYPAHAIDVDALRQLEAVDIRRAITLVDGVLLCRATAMQAEPIRNHFTRLWLALRGALLGREAVAPRIWAT
jgi:urease accessory protein